MATDERTTLEKWLEKKITFIQIKKKHLHDISLLCISAVYLGTLLRLLLQGPDRNLHEELYYPDRETL